MIDKTLAHKTAVERTSAYHNAKRVIGENMLLPS